MCITFVDKIEMKRLLGI